MRISALHTLLQTLDHVCTSDPSLAFQIQLATSPLLEYLADKWSSKYVKLRLSYHPASLGTGFSSTLPVAVPPATWFPNWKPWHYPWLFLLAQGAGMLASHQILSLLPLVSHQSTHFLPSLLPLSSLGYHLEWCNSCLTGFLPSVLIPPTHSLLRRGGVISGNANLMIAILPTTLQLLSIAFRMKRYLPDGWHSPVLSRAPCLGNSYISLMFNVIYFFSESILYPLLPNLG